MLEKIAEIIEEQLGTVSRDEITEETSFKDDLGADSLDLFELVMRCEEEYEIEFPSDFRPVIIEVYHKLPEAVKRAGETM